LWGRHHGQLLVSLLRHRRSTQPWMRLPIVTRLILIRLLVAFVSTTKVRSAFPCSSSSSSSSSSSLSLSCFKNLCFVGKRHLILAAVGVS
jgi:hypothetical protein